MEATLYFLPVRSMATNNNNSTVWVSLLHDSVMLSLFILFKWPTTCAFTNWLMSAIAIEVLCIFYDDYSNYQHDQAHKISTGLTGEFDLHHV